MKQILIINNHGSWCRIVSAVSIAKVEKYVHYVCI